MILNTEQEKLLISQQVAKKLITNTYLTDPNNPNFKYIKDKFFHNEPLERAQLLNTGSGLFQSIAGVYSFYVGKKDGVEINYRRFIEDFSTLGYFTYSLERDEDGDYDVVYQPAENYINDKGVDTILRRYLDTNNNLQKQYILKTTFVGGVIENKLYDYTYGMQSAVEVSLETLRETKDLPKYFDTGLDQVFRVCKEDKTEQFPLSVIKKVESIVYSIDRKICMLDTQFLQHGEQFKIFKDIHLPPNMLDGYQGGKGIDFSKVGHNIIGKSDKAGIEFVGNKNELIADIMVQNEKQVRQISSMTSIPVDFLGLESKEGNVGQGSRTLLQGAFLKKIEWFRNFLDECFEPAYEIMGVEESTRPDIFVKNDGELINELKLAREANLISQYRAIQQYLGLDDEQTELELQRIKEGYLSNNNMVNANTTRPNNNQDNQREDTTDDGQQ